LRNLAFDNETV